jgi:flagellar basal-body rod protein FlgF
MDRLLYIAMNGAKHSMLQQSVTAQNLANASTTGYKAVESAFRAVPVVGEGAATRTFVVDSTPNADLSNGTILTTGRPLDVAINGNGWIAVQDVAGREAYTRNGALEVGANGMLMTNTGRPVIGDGGPISIPENSEVSIGKDGTVSILSNGQYNAMTAIGRIKLVNPPDNAMVRGDDGLFRQSNNQPAVADAAVTLVSGGLESSNVNSVHSLIGIIDQSRFFDMQVKLMQTADENAKSSAQIMSIAG